MTAIATWLHLRDRRHLPADPGQTYARSQRQALAPRPSPGLYQAAGRRSDSSSVFGGKNSKEASGRSAVANSSAMVGWDTAFTLAALVATLPEHPDP